MAEDDDKKLPGVDEEFAALNAELNRIATMPAQTPEQANGVLVALEALRADWKKRPARADLPEWRRVAEGAVDTAFDGMIREMQRHVLLGSAAGVETSLVNKYFKPVLDELSAGLQRAFFEKFSKKPEPGAPPKKLDAADVAGALLILFGPPPKKKP